MAKDIGSNQEKRIREARESLSEADRELAALLETLQTRDRADKQMVSDVVRTAFAKLAAATANLAAVLAETAEKDQ